jgi:hypothetical protein
LHKEIDRSSWVSHQTKVQMEVVATVDKVVIVAGIQVAAIVMEVVADTVEEVADTVEEVVDTVEEVVDTVEVVGDIQEIAEDILEAVEDILEAVVEEASIKDMEMEVDQVVGIKDLHRLVVLVIMLLRTKVMETIKDIRGGNINFSIKQKRLAISTYCPKHKWISRSLTKHIGISTYNKFIGK